MSAKTSNSPPHELKPEQRAAAHTLDRHLSVTAGPGAGKTFVLVERYLEILRSKKVSVDNIVAITFTNRAANEMRQRVRDRIDGLLRQSPDPERQIWLRHKRTLEGAVITTIHGFCSRLLHEFPVEANIDPQFVLLDEHQAAMLLEAVVEEAVADAIHHGDETILQFAQGTGRAALVTALIEGHRKYRDQGLSLDEVEELTAANHTTPLDYARALKEMDARMRELFSAARLTPAAEKKRARAAAEWPRLRELLAQPPNEKNIAAYTQAIEDFWEVRPDKRSHPAIERIDDLLWGEKPGGNDCQRGRLPTIGYDLLARKYALAVLKLLREIDRRLDAEKQRLAVLDFDDLQLRTLRLLDHPEVLRRVSERYRYFLIDEFQDTNGLQRDLMTRLGLARDTNLFIVGDRKQSIYGFRGADVDVFSEMTAAIEAAGGARQSLHLNFRSQQPLIDSLNFLFARIFQARTEIPRSELGQLGYVEHEPSAAVRGADQPPPHVEFMVGIVSPEESANGVFRSSTLAAQERDAEQVAARISAIVSRVHSESSEDARVPKYGDIAILFRAFTGVWTYESALRRAGIPYLTVQGKGFYQREEITDLIQLLRFLDNTTDELALAAILRSPLGGISDNTLLALRCAPWIEGDASATRLHRRNLLRALRRHREIQFIEEPEHLALDRFYGWLESMIERRNRYGIADLLRYAVASAEFLPIIAANFDGAQRVANVEKLFRLAEQFEKSGHLIRDFVHYVEEFEAIGGREGEGQMDETANVVRLMTIHQAKGLEFPIVIIPDLHREGKRTEAAFILDRHKGLTVRVPDGRGRSVRGALFNELAQRNRWREEFESMRLLYVAATRAKDQVIFSGAIEAKSLENLTTTDKEQWLAWLWRTLELEAQAESGVVTPDAGAEMQITIDREPQPPQAFRPAPANAEAKQVIDAARPLAEIFPLLQPVPPEPGQLLRRFSVTQLINFQRCARQYYFERMLRTPGKEERAVWNDAEAPEPPANLTATLKGAVIHRFCETFRAGDDVETRLTASFDDVLEQRQAELVGRIFDIDKVEAVRALMPLARNYLESDVFRRVTAAEASADSKFQIPNSKIGSGDSPSAIRDSPSAIRDSPSAIRHSPSELRHLPSELRHSPSELRHSPSELRHSPSAIRNPQSSPGLWSELRFRLRRPRGILTGTIDKLLITPAKDGEAVDVEIIDFKTNRFSAPRRIPEQTLAPATVQDAQLEARHAQLEVRHAQLEARHGPLEVRHGQLELPGARTDTGQGLLDFDAISEVVEVPDAEPKDEDFARTRVNSAPVENGELHLDDQIRNAAHDYELQMQAYALALRELLPAGVRINSLRATLHFIDPNIETVLAPELLAQNACADSVDAAMEAIASLDGTLDAELFPPLPASHCRMCNYLELCPAGKEWMKSAKR